VAVANRIHPTAVIGAGVELGDDNVVGPYTVIVGPARIGDGNWIGPHVCIGTPPEYRGKPHPAGWDDEQAGAGVVVGDRNIIREYTAITQGTASPTTVGNECYLLARCQVGHDSVLHNLVTMANAVELGGHTNVWSWANLGIGAVVHQRTHIGPGAMVGMGSAVVKDVVPFSVTKGSPARTTGVNRVGLSRLGCPDPVVEEYAAYLAGKAGAVPVGLPAEIAETLAAWFKAQASRPGH
jgi:UDP-N-acetylglucosamine acyltransferase